MISPVVQKHFKKIPGWWRFFSSKELIVVNAVLLVLALVTIIVDVVAYLTVSSDIAIAIYFGVAFLFIVYINLILRLVAKSRISDYFMNALDLKAIYARLFNSFSQLHYLGSNQQNLQALNILVSKGHDFNIPKEAALTSHTKPIHLSYKGNGISFQSQSYHWGKGNNKLSKKVVGLINVEMTNSRFSGPNNFFALAFNAKNPAFVNLPNLATSSQKFNTIYHPKTNHPKFVKRILNNRVTARMVNLATHGLNVKSFTLEKNKANIFIKFELKRPLLTYSPNVRTKTKYDALGAVIASQTIQRAFQIYLLIRLAIDSTLI